MCDSSSDIILVVYAKDIASLGGAMESEHRALVMEIDMMKDIGCHRNVVSMVACCTSREHLALVMEYVPYGNLQSFLKKHRNEVREDPLTHHVHVRSFICPLRLPQSRPWITHTHQTLWEGITRIS